MIISLQGDGPGIWTQDILKQNPAWISRHSYHKERFSNFKFMFYHGSHRAATNTELYYVGSYTRRGDSIS